MRIKHVLAVEDEPLLLESVAENLEEEGLTVYRAVNADAAIQILDAGTQVDLLFTDIRMPGSIDGWDLAELARMSRPKIKVLYTSGYSDVEGRRVPDSLFVFKPYRVFAILKAMQVLEANSDCSA